MYCVGQSYYFNIILAQGVYGLGWAIPTKHDGVGLIWVIVFLNWVGSSLNIFNQDGAIFLGPSVHVYFRFEMEAKKS